MNGDLALEVQQAIFDKLSGDAALVGMVGRNPKLNNAPNVYDHVPDDKELGEVDGTDRRFIQIGDYSATDGGDKSDPGQVGMFDIYCWSRAKGNTSALLVARRVVQLMHEKPMPLNKGEAVLVRLSFAGMMRDPDGMSRKAIRRFNIITSDPPTAEE